MAVARIGLSASCGQSDLVRRLRGKRTNGPDSAAVLIVLGPNASAGNLPFFDPKSVTAG